MNQTTKFLNINMSKAAEKTGLMEKLQTMNEIIYPEIEPAIINKEMIEKEFLESGYKGEAARLHQMAPVVFDRITTLRLEFKNILRIDHLWIMPNLTKLSLNANKIEVIEHIEMLTSLKELDLSFNYIEKIENLEKLVKLEVLTLFNNLITKIENLDTLENLVILSIGNNNIESTKGIERLRFFKKLSVLNLEGNPIAKNPEYPLSQYIAAILPNVKYYDYVAISEEQRTKARERFFRELREIEADEEIEIITRSHRAKEELDAQRLSSSFVEHLNDHQLFETIWKGDEEARALMMVGVEADLLKEEYDKDIYNITQKIYKYGLEQYEERDLEIKEFHSNLEEGQAEVQLAGQKTIEKFLRYKDKVFETATMNLKNYELRTIQGEDEESPESLDLMHRYEALVVEFDDASNVVWQELMTQELHLHEVTEESIVNFQFNIQEMMTKFVEHVNSLFVQLRDIALHFSESLTDIVSHYITQKTALQDFTDVPHELLHCMEDRDALANLVTGMKDTQSSRIDEREDRLVQRSKKFIEDMIDKINGDELERNRAKILEINAFLEMMSESLANLQMEVREGIMKEEA